MSWEMGRVLRNEKRIVLTLLRERASFSFMLKRAFFDGLILKNLKQRSDSFCLAKDRMMGDGILWH
jgi:hypothetical protein